jgi:beta-phosphoglucomutase-like phosphatase (HAD superfamily)
VIEDSIVGLKAAKGAGMMCIITYTPNTKGEVCDSTSDSYIYICIYTSNFLYIYIYMYNWMNTHT